MENRLHFITSLIVLLTFCFKSLVAQDAETQDATRRLKEAESEINILYHQILDEYKDQKLFIKNLSEAQALWVRLKQAELKTLFPESPDNYGSPYQMCVANYLTELTLERIARLELWRKGTYEGDVCSGSIRINN
jgi:uncharacterized protein YecT (DUF1311 family)